MPERTGPQLVGIASAGEQESSSTGKFTLRKRKRCSYAKIRQMREHPTAALGRWLCSAPIISSGWITEARDDAPKGAKEFIDREMQRIRFHLLSTAVLGLLDYGWQSYEKVFDVRDSGLLGVKKLKQLLPDLTDVLVDEDTGAFEGLSNRTEELGVHECLLYSNEVEGTDWYGKSILGSLEGTYDSWEEVYAVSKRHDVKVAGTHLIIRYPIGTSEVPNEGDVDNQVLANRVIKNWQATGAVAVPVDPDAKSELAQWKIDLISETGAGAAGFIARLSYLDKLLVRGFGLPERAVLEGTYGTKAEAEAHADFAILNLELRHEALVQCTNWHLVNHLLRLDYGEQYEDSVFIKAQPITDKSKTFLRQLYQKFLENPDNALIEMGSVDRTALRESIGVPTQVKPETDRPGGPAPGTVTAPETPPAKIVALGTRSGQRRPTRRRTSKPSTVVIR